MRATCSSTATSAWRSASARPVAVQQRRGPKRGDHSLGGAGLERRDGKGAILQQVGHDAAEAGHHHRAELGIGGESDDRLHAGRRHRLDHAPPIRAPSRACIVSYAARTASESASPSLDAADVGLVHHIARPGLEDHGEPDRLGRRGCLRRGRRAASRQHRHPAGRQQSRRLIELKPAPAGAGGELGRDDLADHRLVRPFFGLIRRQQRAPAPLRVGTDMPQGCRRSLW